MEECEKYCDSDEYCEGFVMPARSELDRGCELRTNVRLQKCEAGTGWDFYSRSTESLMA